MNAELGVGMDTPQTVAAAILRALSNERGELLLGAPERVFAKLNALFPRLIDRSLRRQLGIVRRYASASAVQTAAPTPALITHS
jgi:hypothetical protein